MSPQPLSGIRVLDLTNVLAGPFCCHQLAHLGADVIKVEVPGAGDLARQLGADPALNAKLMGVSFMAQNTGKRSLTLNLKSAAGKTAFKRLVQTADVVVENFRPGVMKRLGLDYDALKADHDALIYCAISGFGQDGPLAHLPAYDQIIQGMSGVMDITGASDTAPYRVGYPMADTIGGLTAAFAISAALAEPKDRRGRMIDVSMLESVIATMGWVVSNHLMAGKHPQPMGNDNFTAAPSGTFQTGDGLINISANKQEQFEALCDAVGRGDLKADARFAVRQSRLDNRPALTVEIEAALASQSAMDWFEALSAVGVPCGPVQSVPDALAHRHIVERGQIQSAGIAPGTDNEVRIAAPGFRLDGETPSTDAPPPALGADTDAILGELGYSANDIAVLREEGAL
ncbi:MAG: CaiB/BaiF CoA-transferase family protein [Pseudomonadota bacterium]